MVASEPLSNRAPRSWLLFTMLFALVAVSTNQLDYKADHQQIVEGAGDILSYYAMSEAAPDLVDKPVPYHHAQRIFLPYLLGMVSRLTGQPIQFVYLVVGTILLFAALLLFVHCCELLDFSESTVVVVGCLVLFNPYVFRHLIMFNGYINDIGFLAGISLCLYAVFSKRRGLLLAGILFSALSRQTTLLTIPAWVLLEYLVDGRKKWRIDALTIGYWVVPILVYIGTSAIAVRTGLPSETKMALFGIFYWLESSFSLGRLASFIVRGCIPFAFLACAWIGLRRKSISIAATPPVVWALLLLAFSICIQPILGGPDWTTNSIARLNALAVFPLALAVGMVVNGAVARLSPAVLCAVGTLICLGSIHHIYTFNGEFTADKNAWFAAIHFLAAATAGILLKRS